MRLSHVVIRPGTGEEKSPCSAACISVYRALFSASNVRLFFGKKTRPYKQSYLSSCDEIVVNYLHGQVNSGHVIYNTILCKPPERNPS